MFNIFLFPYMPKERVWYYWLAKLSWITFGEVFYFYFSVCGFTFHSENEPNGTFTSPNFPGLYPRNTECHYLFFGQDNDRIHITFPYFDVEGIPPGWVAGIVACRLSAVIIVTVPCSSRQHNLACTLDQWYAYWYTAAMILNVRARPVFVFLKDIWGLKMAVNIYFPSW